MAAQIKLYDLEFLDDDNTLYLGTNIKAESLEGATLIAKLFLNVPSSSELISSNETTIH